MSLYPFKAYDRNATLLSRQTSGTLIPKIPNGINFGNYLYWDNGWKNGNDKVNIGNNAGKNNSQNNIIAIGKSAGEFIQGTGAIAIGTNAGKSTQQENAISIGQDSGYIRQGTYSVAIGYEAGHFEQYEKSIAIGHKAGSTGQGVEAIAIGYKAGANFQGKYSIAIGSGAGQGFQNQRTIAINGTGVPFSADDEESCYIAPLRFHPIGGTPEDMVGVGYSQSRNELFNTDAQSFVIQHPIEDNKYLVHACLEGPEAGIYYRGKGEIINHEFLEIYLPSYVDKIGKDFTVYITPVYNSSKDIGNHYGASPVKDGKFTVFGPNGQFNWMVMGSRKEIEAEVLKEKVELKNVGPYTWLELSK